MTIQSHEFLLIPREGLPRNSRFPSGAVVDPDPPGTPVITSFSGTLEEGEQITINGSDFGTKTQAAPIFFDTQDKVWRRGIMSQPYSGITSGSVVPTGWEAAYPDTRWDQGYPWRGNGNDMRLVNDGGYPRYLADFETADTWGNHRIVTLSTPPGLPETTNGDIRELYIRWWIKLSFAPAGGSQKFIRIWNSRDEDRTYAFTWDHVKMTYILWEGSGGGGTNGSNWGGWGGIVGQWNLMELHAKVPTTTTATFLARVNNSVRIDAGPGSVDDISSPNGIHPRGWGYDGSAGDWRGETAEFSDFYMDTTCARVEIGDASTWNACAVREPQIPTAWSDTQITVELYKGRLHQFSGRYLYVWNSEGNVNSSGILL